jgi:hypothetical protein
MAQCGSWPFCELPPIRGGRFCQEHQEILDRVRLSLGRRSAKKSIVRPPATVTVTQIEKPATVKPPAKRRSSPKFEAYRSAIVEHLQHGPLGSAQLAARCGAGVNSATFGRSRRSLLSDGSICVSGHVGRSFEYGLAPQQEPTAA